jgi:hypothetical protein
MEDKYIHENRREGDCQLVSIVNAYHFLTGKTVSDKLYNELADECGCVAGSCINTKPAFERLNLYVKHKWKYLPSGEVVLPLEINVWHKYFGFHSILAIGWEPLTESFKVTNFNHVASGRNWIFQEDLIHYVIENPNKDRPRWKCRTIGLK